MKETKITCPKCGKPVKPDIAKALDEEGELHVCPHCGQKYRFTEK
jgi:DNA-directed RNA polymerase subunit RPC12/RpoP